MNQDSSGTSSTRQYRRVERSIADGRTPTTTEYDSHRMSRIRQSGTVPELVVRKACRDLGLSYRLKNRDLPGSPDIANRSRRWAVFVHGCFWHQHPACAKATIPKRNKRYWQAKFQKNRLRDENAQRKLQCMGYTCLVIWECEAADESVLLQRLGRLAYTCNSHVAPTTDGKS